MNKGILVQDRRKKYAKKPDYWMICREELTDEEIQPYKKILKKLKVTFLPLGVNCRLGNPFSKKRILNWLESINEKGKL